jgi:hypothetical protein
VKELQDYLGALAPGSIVDARQLECLLSPVWHEFEGTDAERMAAIKLHGRMEEVVWEPPVLQGRVASSGGRG